MMKATPSRTTALDERGKDLLAKHIEALQASRREVKATESDEAHAGSSPVQEEQGKHVHKLYSAEKIASCLAGANDETREVVRQMQRSGAYRPLVMVPTNFREIAAGLAEDFPNFSSYIQEILLPSLALSHLTGSALHLEPALFLGPPGIGKSLFVSALADRFGGDFSRVNAEAGAASFSLVGLSRGYSSASPGQLFRWLAQEARTANGFFVIEELDKARAGDDRFPVLNTLIQLLEPHTAKSFGDQSVPELKLDLSRLNFLFTANGLDGVSEPILSRMLVVDIPSLTIHQAQAVALRQYEKLIEALDLPIPAPVLTEEGMEVLRTESPRRQRILLQLAVGRAVLENAPCLRIRHHDQRAKAGIGFL